MTNETFQVDHSNTGHRRRRVVVLGVAALVAAAAAAVWLFNRSDNPTLLGDRTATGILSMDARPLNSAGGFAGITFPGPGNRHETVTFHGVPAVHFAVNSAAATARIAVCREAVGVGAYGDGRTRDLMVACSQVRDVIDGVTMRWDEGENHKTREYLVVIVKPTKAGIATVDRVDFDYELESGASGKDVGHLSFTVKAK